MTPLFVFIGAALSATLIGASIWFADRKGEVWMWSMYAGALLIATGGFGYIIPNEIPQGDVIIVCGVFTMMLGVSLSYMSKPALVGQSELERLLLLQQRTTGLRIIIFGVSITAIFAGFILYNFTHPGQEQGVIGILVRVEKTLTVVVQNQSEQKAGILANKQAIASLVYRERLKSHRDSLYQRDAAERGKKILQQGTQPPR